MIYDRLRILEFNASIPDRPILIGILALALVAAAGCGKKGEDKSGDSGLEGGTSPSGDADTDTDTDADTDADGDADTDTDGDADTDTDGDTDTDTDADTDADTDTATDCADAETDCPDPESVCYTYRCHDEICQMVPAVYGTPCEDDGNECTMNVCDGTDGVCLAEVIVGTECTDDNNECTFDVCFEGICGKPLTGADCTYDSNPCTVDKCIEGVCGSVALDNGAICDNGIWCDGAEQCMGGTCVSKAGTNPCTDLPCLHSPDCTEPSVWDEGMCGADAHRPDETVCDPDNAWCTGEGECWSGLCAPGPEPCTDVDFGICREAKCNEDLDQCDPSNLPDTTACPNDVICDEGGNEVCQQGECKGNLPACYDSNPCTDDMDCDEQSAGPGVPREVYCGWDVFKNGTVCDPRNLCAGSGVNKCVGGECAYAENPPCPLDGDGSFCSYVGLCSHVGDAGTATCTLPIPNDPAFDLLGCTDDADAGMSNSVVINTTSVNNERTAYNGCSGNFSGGEMVFEISLPADSTYTLTLNTIDTTVKEDLWMLIISDPCDPNGTCYDSGTGTLVDLEMPSSGARYVVVDGRNGNRGLASLSISSDACP